MATESGTIGDMASDGRDAETFNRGEKMEIGELQADIDELQRDANSIINALANAESCETSEDFKTNLAEAVRDLKSLTKRASNLYAKSQKLKTV